MSGNNGNLSSRPLAIPGTNIARTNYGMSKREEVSMFLMAALLNNANNCKNLKGTAKKAMAATNALLDEWDTQNG